MSSLEGQSPKPQESSENKEALPFYQIQIDKGRTAATDKRAQKVETLFSDSISSDGVRNLRSLVTDPNKLRVKVAGMSADSFTSEVDNDRVESILERLKQGESFDHILRAGLSDGDSDTLDEVLGSLRTFALRLQQVAGSKNNLEWESDSWQKKGRAAIARLAERLEIEAYLRPLQEGYEFEESSFDRHRFKNRLAKYVETVDISQRFRGELEDFLRVEEGVDNADEESGSDESDEEEGAVDSEEVVEGGTKIVERLDDVEEEGGLVEDLTAGAIMRQRRALEDPRYATALESYREQMDDIYRAVLDQRGGYDEALIDHLQVVGEELCDKEEPWRERDRLLGRPDRRYEKRALNNFLDTLSTQMQRAMDVGRGGQWGEVGMLKKAERAFNKAGAFYDVFGWSGLAKRFVPRVPPVIRLLPAFKDLDGYILGKRREIQSDMVSVQRLASRTFARAAQTIKAAGESKQEVRAAVDLRNFLKVHAAELELAQLQESEQVQSLYQADLGEDVGVVMVRARSGHEARRRFLKKAGDTERAVEIEEVEEVKPGFWGKVWEMLFEDEEEDTGSETEEDEVGEKERGTGRFFRSLFRVGGK